MADGFSQDDLVYCHAHQCSVAAICEALGLKPAHVFPTPYALRCRRRRPDYIHEPIDCQIRDVSTQDGFDPDEPPSPVMSERAHTACAHPHRQTQIAVLAGVLGVTRASLESLRVGWIDLERNGHSWWAIPEYDGHGRVVGVGYRRHADNGKKIRCFETGGHRGLILPHDLDARLKQPNGRLYICEGMSDTAALLSAGRVAIGRASARASKRERAWLAQFVVQRCRDLDVVVVGDRNEAGIAGAQDLRLLLSCNMAQFGRQVQWALPLRGYSDVREQWVATGSIKLMMQNGI